MRERAERPAVPAAAQPGGVEPRPPVDGRGLGEDGRHQPAGDRPAQDHEVGVERQLAHLLGVPLPRADDGVVAGVELLAERGDGRLGGRGVVRRPLGERRVPGLVHADESCHEGSLRCGRARPSYAARRRAGASVAVGRGELAGQLRVLVAQQVAELLEQAAGSGRRRGVERDEDLLGRLPPTRSR